MKNLLKTIFPFLIALSVQGVDLDAPMKKEITIRSEIQRGLAAVAALPPPTIPLYYHRSVTALVYENQQRNEDTPGFVFGVNYATWHILWNALSSRSYSDPFEDRIAAGHANICYTIAVEMQKKLGLSDEELAKVCGKYFMKDEVARFQELLKSKQFENSYALASSQSSKSQ